MLVQNAELFFSSQCLSIKRKSTGQSPMNILAFISSIKEKEHSYLAEMTIVLRNFQFSLLPIKVFPLSKSMGLSPSHEMNESNVNGNRNAKRKGERVLRRLEGMSLLKKLRTCLKKKLYTF